MPASQEGLVQSNTRGILFTTTITSFFNPFLGAAVNIALPAISMEFNANTVAMSWIAMAYLLSSVVFLIPFGKLSDILGRRNIFLYGNIILTAGSLLCALSFSIASMIIFRVIQGIGSAMIFSSSMAIITSAIPPEKRGRAIGFNVSAVYLGLTGSPVLGGILTNLLGWRSIFILSILSGIIIITSILMMIKKDTLAATIEKYDVIGTLIYMLSMFSLIYGFSNLPEFKAQILTITGISGLVLFVFYELGLKEPLFELSLFFKNRIFAFSNLAALINYAATFAITFYLSLYLQYIKGFSAGKSGFFLMFQPAVMTIVAWFAGRLSDKKDAGILSSIGMGVNVVGLIMLIFINSVDNTIYLIAALMILGFGFGLFSSPNTNAIMGSVERKHLGIASATVSTMRLLGQVTSMAMATLLLNVFIGGKKILPVNFANFNASMKVLFIIFSILCFIGVFASLARKKR